MISSRDYTITSWDATEADSITVSVESRRSVLTGRFYVYYLWPG